MKHTFAQIGVLARSLLIAFAAVMPSQATNSVSGTSPFVAHPFVAAEKQDTTDFSSGLVTAPGNPLSIRVNNVAVAKGTYAGVRLTTDQPCDDFQSISFLLAGPKTTQIAVHAQGRGTSQFRYARSSAGAGVKSGAIDARGFQLVSFDASQLNIRPGDAVDEIIISTDGNEKNANFKVSDIRVNGQTVTQSVERGTQFFKVVNGSPSGPALTAHSKLGGLPATPATISVTNGTNAQQYFYINLLLPSQTTPSYPANEEIQSLSNVTATVSGNVATCSAEGGICQIDSTHGYFFLNAGDTVSFATTPSNATFSAQIFINGTSPTSTTWPDNSQCITNVNSSNQPVEGPGVGATFAEFTINGDPTYILPDTADISEVNGVNAKYIINFPPISLHASSTGYPKFFCCSSYLFYQATHTHWGTFQQGQFIPVPSIANHPGSAPPFTNDSTGSNLFPISPAEATPNAGTHYSNGTVGVYPFGCDKCTAISSPGCPPVSNYGATKPQSHSICQVSRPVASLGGTIKIKLTTFPWPAASR